MHQTLEKLYNVQFEFQSNLFPEIKEELGDLSKYLMLLFRILAKENVARLNHVWH